MLRSLTRKAQRTDRAAQALADLADSGPLAELVGRVPPRRRAADLAALAAAARRRGALVAAPPGLPRPAAGGSPSARRALRPSSPASPSPRPLKGALDWLVPPLFRAAEYGTVLILAANADVNGALPAAFGLVAAVAYHHYDTVYRIRGGTGAPPHWLVRAIGGHEGRTLLVTVLAALLDRGHRFHRRAHRARRGRRAGGARREHPLLGVLQEHPPYTTKENPHDRPRAGGRRRTASAPLHRHPSQGPGAGGPRGRRGDPPSST